MNKKIIQQTCLTILPVLAALCVPYVEIQAQPQMQTVSINMENVRMRQVMTEIERQTKYLFGINDDVDVDKTVTVNVTDQSLQSALDQMVRGTGINYRISNSNIILSKGQPENPASINGTISDTNGMPIVGATVLIQGTLTGTSTDSDGLFSLEISSKILPPPTYTVGNQLSRL